MNTLPVLQNTSSHTAMARMTGKGYKGILKGSDAVPKRRRSSTNPTACPTNWMRMRMARMAVMTSPSRNSRLNTKPTPPTLT